MHFSTSTFVTVLLAAVAQDITATAQQDNNGNAGAANGNDGPLSIQTVGNDAPSASGLRQPPNLQADESPASLQPLPGLANGDAITPTVVVETSAAVSVITTQVGAQPAVTPTQEPAESLRQPPGLNGDAVASLLPLPGSLTLATSIPEAATSEAAQVIPSLTPIVDGTASAVAEETSTAATASEDTTAVAASSSAEAVAETTSAAAASDSTTLAVLHSNSTALAALSSLPQIAGGASSTTTTTSSTAHPSFVAPPKGFLFANATAGAGAAKPGVAHPTAAPPYHGAGGSNSNSTTTGHNSTSPSLPPLPGNGSDSGSSETLPSTLLTATATASADSSSGDGGGDGGALTTLTTVSDGVTRTVVTAVAAQTTGSGLLGVGANANANGTGNADAPAESGAGGGVVAGRSVGWAAIVAGLVGWFGALSL
ncbi:hypothetical protein N658DRAFT_503713 [Parathielavia hyrcaniae]|uniref:Uncharacterized protein n=1 Tax=Parathielavia hyrcaniae TaxID=113614 RepID=A0AAN6T568_9PEZI|nr:hypothetical protein N658DRAFT_503713 [Parathielavia hyrcaniae]